MKKILILIIPLLLTGCFGGAGQGYLTNTCIKEEFSDGFKSTVIYVVDFKSDDINHVKITNSYESSNDNGKLSLNAVKETVRNYNQKVKNMKGVTITIVEDTDSKALIDYDIDYSLISDDDLKFFELVDDYNTQINKLKEKNMECK